MKTLIVLLCLVVAGQSHAGGGAAAAGAAMMILNNAAVMQQQHMNEMMSHEIIRQGNAIRQSAESGGYTSHENKPSCGKPHEVFVATPETVNTTTHSPSGVGLRNNGKPYLFTATSSFMMPKEYKATYQGGETAKILFDDSFPLPPGEYVPPPYEYHIWENGWWIEKYREFIKWWNE